MTFNMLFQAISQNVLFGGVAASILLFLMFRKANKVAQTGNKAAMATWAMAPSLMILTSVIVTGAAVGIALPRLQAMFTSVPMQNTMAVGNALTVALDGFLFSDPNTGLMVSAPTYGTQPTASTGAVTFTSQPAPAPAANNPVQITTNEQAVAAINALAQPTAEPLAYINQFVADNTQTIEVETDATGSYTIKSGDSLAKIAKAVYGDSSKWTLICNANRNVVPDCNNIRAGVALVIPNADSVPVNSQVVNQTVNQVPANFGQQAATYTQQQAVAPVRNVANGEVVITSNSDAVAAIQNLAPAAVAQPTPRAAYVLSEVLGKPSNNTGMEYINKFLAENSNQQVAQSGN